MSNFVKRYRCVRLNKTQATDVLVSLMGTSLLLSLDKGETWTHLFELDELEDSNETILQYVTKNYATQP